MRYVPQFPGQAYTADIAWRELQTLREVTNSLFDRTFEADSMEPSRLEAGMLRYADGTNWNPGKGSGLYFYDGADWQPLVNETTSRVRRYFEAQK